MRKERKRNSRRMHFLIGDVKISDPSARRAAQNQCVHTHTEAVLPILLTLLEEPEEHLESSSSSHRPSVLRTGRFSVSPVVGAGFASRKEQTDRSSTTQIYITTFTMQCTTQRTIFPPMNYNILSLTNLGLKMRT